MAACAPSLSQAVHSAVTILPPRPVHTCDPGRVIFFQVSPKAGGPPANPGITLVSAPWTPSVSQRPRPAGCCHPPLAQKGSRLPQVPLQSRAPRLVGVQDQEAGPLVSLPCTGHRGCCTRCLCAMEPILVVGAVGGWAVPADPRRACCKQGPCRLCREPPLTPNPVCAQRWPQESQSGPVCVGGGVGKNRHACDGSHSPGTRYFYWLIA